MSSATSSELSDPGRLAGGRNRSPSPEKPAPAPAAAAINFSQTCSLLSQYLKEKGTLGDLTPLGAPEMFRRAAAANPVSFAAPRPVKSMDLFPQQAGFGSAKGDAAAKVAAAAAADSM